MQPIHVEVIFALVFYAGEKEREGDKNSLDCVKGKREISHLSTIYTNKWYNKLFFIINVFA